MQPKTAQEAIDTLRQALEEPMAHENEIAALLAEIDVLRKALHERGESREDRP